MMKHLIGSLLLGLAFVIASQSQTLYKCSTASGGTEYRNSPCEKGQASKGAVNKGTVTSISPSADSASPTSPSASSPSKGESTLSVLGLNALLNPIKAMRDDAAPVDGVAAGLCKSEGGFYVEGAGCLSQPPKNRNPLIGEAKMRDICKQTTQTYVKALNDCVSATKPAN
jgi:hypothetical protein